MHWIALQAPPADAAEALSDPATALGWWALRFTPRVTRVDEALLLEISASERLFGGRRALLRALFDPAAMPLQPEHRAQGATALLALARLRCEGSARTPADDLPLHSLSAAREHLETLERIGCRHWKQLRALPRDGVARRFGAPLLRALDEAYGEQPESHAWLVCPETFCARLELGALVEDAPALLFGAWRLLGQLRAWLQARQRGVLGLRLLWQMDARRGAASEGELVLRTGEATQDMAHLQRLLGEHLARVTLPAPVHHLQLESLQTADLPHAVRSLLPEELRTGDSFRQMLERLAARLGEQRVLRAVPCADHRPEHMQRWEAAGAAREAATHNAQPRATAGAAAAQAQAAATRIDEALYPGWLLAAPLKLAVQNERPQYQGPLQLLVGPQRLEAGWWDSAGAPAKPAAQDARAARRDYFIARSPQAGLLWIYRERLSHWYLHGLFA